MPDLRKCEFFLLRYVPDAVKDEFVNIGVLVLDAEGANGVNSEPFAQVRFTDDWSRVRCIDPTVDIESAGRIRRGRARGIGAWP